MGMDNCVYDPYINYNELEDYCISRIYRGYLENKHEIIFITGKNMDISFDIDWVIIASSTQSHYDICKLFIQRKINIFVEKPMTYSVEKTKELLSLAYRSKIKIYIDDVFLYHNKFKTIPKNQIYKFRWLKYGTFKNNLWNS